MSENVQDRIDHMVKDNPVLLFMKGTPDSPRCGFSAAVVDILEDAGARFASFDVLSDPAVRAGVKTYGGWPTLPQLYVNGQLVGGCDIVREMHAAGELEPMLKTTR